MKELNFYHVDVAKEKLIEDLMNVPFMNNFFITNDLDTDTIESFLLDFMTYHKEKSTCLNCKGLKECKLDNKGLEPVISYRNKKIQYQYQECPYLLSTKQEASKLAHIDAMHLPKSILQASLDGFDFDRGENREKIYAAVTSFLTKMKNNQQAQGMYFFGAYGKGKTYILSAIATELMRIDKNVVLAYYPDLVREFKSRISDNSLESVVSKLKQVDVLMLDDIGAEGNSPWVRDEVLGPIIQFRLLDNKPTFFSSNMSYKELVDVHFSSGRDQTEKLRAYRVGTRIKDLVGDHIYQV